MVFWSLTSFFCLNLKLQKFINWAHKFFLFHLVEALLINFRNQLFSRSFKLGNDDLLNYIASFFTTSINNCGNLSSGLSTDMDSFSLVSNVKNSYIISSLDLKHPKFTAFFIIFERLFIFRFFRFFIIFISIRIQKLG